MTASLRNSSLEEHYNESYSTDEDYISSEESFGESFQNSHGYEFSSSEEEPKHESRKDYDSSRMEHVMEEKGSKVSTDGSLLPGEKYLPESEAHLSSSLEEIEKENMGVTEDEKNHTERDQKLEDGTQETGIWSSRGEKQGDEVLPDGTLLSKAESSPDGQLVPEGNPQNFRRPCIPFVGSKGERRTARYSLLLVPIFFIFVLE